MHSFVANVQPGGLLGVDVLGVDADTLLIDQPILLARHQHRGEEPLGVVLQSLPPAVIVDARPAGHRPAVVELPNYRPHTAAPVPPPVLHAVLHGLGLEELGGVDQLIQAVGVQVNLG